LCVNFLRFLRDVSPVAVSRELRLRVLTERSLSAHFVRLCGVLASFDSKIPIRLLLR
jgi:hypothetical protein